jgi:hypothetical protein
MPETGTPLDDATASSINDGTIGVDAGLVDAGVQPDVGLADVGVQPDVAVQDAADVSSGCSNLIENPDFDAGYTGWTFAPPSAEGTTAFVQSTMDGIPTATPYMLATYSQTTAFTVDVSQTITGLQDGQYTFEANFNCSVLNQAYIYAKGCDGTTDGGMFRSDIPATSPTGWEGVTLYHITVTGGSCQVGLFVDSAPNQWLNAIEFRFCPGGGPPETGDAATD